MKICQIYGYKMPNSDVLFVNFPEYFTSNSNRRLRRPSDRDSTFILSVPVTLSGEHRATLDNPVGPARVRVVLALDINPAWMTSRDLGMTRGRWQRPQPEGGAGRAHSRFLVPAALSGHIKLLLLDFLHSTSNFAVEFVALLTILRCDDVVCV